MLDKLILLIGIPIAFFALRDEPGWLAAIAAVVVFDFWLAGTVQKRAIRQEARGMGLTDIRFMSGGAFVNPGDLPWYRGWSYFTFHANDPGGVRREYWAYLTSIVFGLFDHTVSISTNEDYDVHNAKGERISDSSIVDRSETGSSGG